MQATQRSEHALNIAFHQSIASLVGQGLPEQAVRTALQLVYEAVLIHPAAQDWTSKTQAEVFLQIVGQLRGSYPSPATWEAILPRNFEQGGMHSVFKMSIFRMAARGIQGPALLGHEKASTPPRTSFSTATVLAPDMDRFLRDQGTRLRKGQTLEESGT